MKIQPLEMRPVPPQNLPRINPPTVYVGQAPPPRMLSINILRACITLGVIAPYLDLELRLHYLQRARALLVVLGGELGARSCASGALVGIPTLSTCCFARVHAGGSVA